MYKANNVDTDKALQAIENNRRYMEERERYERYGVEKYYAGVRKGIEMAKELFECSNYEKIPIKVIANDDIFICPKCKNDLMIYGMGEKDVEYCSFCGQRLQW